jgi:hypothetical protein
MYKCKYCGVECSTPLELARHVRMKHKRVKKKEKKKGKEEARVKEIYETVEAIGVLKGLQVSSNLSDDEKNTLGEVVTKIERLLLTVQEK